MCTTGNNTTDSSQQTYDAVILQVTAVILAVLGCVGVIGNTITALALAFCRRLRNFTTIFVVNLAIADMLFALISTPITIMWCVTQDHLWVDHNIGCHFYVYSGHVLVSVSLCSMAAVAVTRLLVIINKRPGNKFVDWKRVIVGLVMCWAFPMATLAFPLFGVWGQFGPNKKSIGGCTIIAPRNDVNNSPKIYIYGTGIGIPLACIGVCYCAIFFLVWRSRSRLPKMTRCATGPSDWNYLSDSTRSRGYSLDLPYPPETSSPNPEQWDCLPRRFSVRSFVGRVLFGSEYHLTKMMGTCFLAAILCFVPVVLFEFFDEHICNTTLNMVVTIPVWISGSLNPIIYTIMSRQYRQAYASLLRKVT